MSAEDFKVAAYYYRQNLDCRQEPMVQARSVGDEDGWVLFFALQDCPDFDTLLRLLKERRCIGDFEWSIFRDPNHKRPRPKMSGTGRVE